MRFLRPLLFLLGLGLLVLFVVQNDPPAILESIKSLSWRIVVLVFLPHVLVAWFDTLGWRLAFPEDRVPMRTLFSVRMAGEAVNLATPTGAVGGEFVKAWLVRPQVSLGDGVLSVIVAKTTITVAQGIFLLIGIVLAWHTLSVGSKLLAAMLLLLGMEVLALAGFVVAQTRGLLGRAEQLVRFTRLYRGPANAGIARVDEALARFYREEPRRLALSTFFHLVGWLLGSIEAYLILRFLGVEVSLITATVIEALGTGIRFATFFIPASLGVLEGGHAALFAALGLGSSMGVSFTLVRRIREAAWVLFGLLALVVVRGRTAGVTEPPPS